MHNGTTITDLENLVERVSAHAEKGQDPHDEIATISPAPPSPVCECGEPATKTYGKQPVCADCHEGLNATDCMSWAEYYGYDVR